MERLRAIIRECISEVLNESQGVVERGYDAFAEYLWKRCSNCRIRTDRNGDINFTIPAPQWAKFNTYGISTDKISVRITDRGGRAAASFGYWGLGRSNSGYPEIMITRDLIESGHDSFIEAVMHELTHSVNKMANVKDKDDKAIIRRQESKLKRQAAQGGSLPNRIAYLYDPSEINARLTQAYYYLKNNKEKLINYSNTEINKNTFVYNLFYDIDSITCYSEMVKYINMIDEEHFWQNQMFADKGSYPTKDSENYSKYWPLISHLSYKGSNAHKSAKEFPVFFKNKLKIKGFMQQVCEKFKRRIYKMIYKFISENNLDRNVEDSNRRFYEDENNRDFWV